MSILILADRVFSEAPGLGRQPIAMLPLGGASVIGQLLEELAARGATQVQVVPPAGDAAMRLHLEGARPPRLQLTFLDQAPELADAWTFVLRGDMWITPAALDAGLSAYRDGRDPPPRLRAEGVSAARAGEPISTWRETRAAALRRIDAEPHVARHALLTPRDYVRLAIAAGADEIPLLVKTGWPDESGARVGLDASIRTRHPFGAGVQVGARAYVEEDVVLGDGAIVGEDCLIARGAHVSHSVVLPGATVASGLRVRDALVFGETILRVDIGVELDLATDCISGRCMA